MAGQRSVRILSAIAASCALIAMTACVGYESSESSSSGSQEEAWYEGAGFFYLDKLMFDKEGQDSVFSTKRKNNQKSEVNIFRQTKNKSNFVR